MIANKHFQPAVIAKAVSKYLFGERVTQASVAREVGCSRRTVGRWIRWLAALAEPSVLVEKLVAAVDEPVLPRAHDLSIAPRRPKAKGPGVLTRTAEVLGLMEALASAWGLWAPGLCSVLYVVLRGRSRVATYARPLIPELARGPPG
jgi:hypothetical protein